MRHVQVAGLVVAVAGLGLLIIAVFGNPVYGFYSPMKLAVAGSAAYVAWRVHELNTSWWFLPPLLILVEVYALSAQLKRTEWVIPDAIQGLLLAAGFCAILYAKPATVRPKGVGEA